MQFTLKDPNGKTYVTWQDGDIWGGGPGYDAALNAFFDRTPFGLTATGPMVVPDIEDPVSAYLTICYYGFVDTAPEEIDVPPGVTQAVDDMTRLNPGDEG